jgi:hypothetical protein
VGGRQGQHTLPTGNLKVPVDHGDPRGPPRLLSCKWRPASPGPPWRLAPQPEGARARRADGPLATPSGACQRHVRLATLTLPAAGP